MKRKHYPDWLAECAGQMRDRSVHRDHDIELGDQRCGVREVIQSLRDIAQWRCAQRVAIMIADKLLQRKSFAPINQDRQQCVQPNAAADIMRMLRIA